LRDNALLWFCRHECIPQDQLAKALPDILKKYKDFKKSTNIPPLDLSIYEEISKKIPDSPPMISDADLHQPAAQSPAPSASGI
jgi:hypothetical protein